MVDMPGSPEPWWSGRERAGGRSRVVEEPAAHPGPRAGVEPGHTHVPAGCPGHAGVLQRCRRPPALGKQFADLGEIPADEFGQSLQLALPEGQSLRLRESPAGIAFFERHPADKTLVATSYDGVRRRYEATAYPLFGAEGEMHGVISIFWEDDPVEAEQPG